MFNHDTFRQTSTPFNNIYLGVVEDNNDPDEAGKVAVRIAGLHSPEKTKSDMGGIPTSELPWALPMMPIVGGGVSGLGYNGVPRQGDWVAIFFVGGDHNHPVYMGVIKGNPVTAPDSSKGYNDPDGVYPETLGEPDFNNKSAEIKAEKNGNLETFEPISVADPTYPNNTVLETSGDGIFVEYDSTPSKERWHVYHKGSKSYCEINSNGNMVLKSTNDRYDITAGDKKTYVKGTNIIQSDGKATLKGDAVDIDGGGGNITSVVCMKNICPLLGSGHIDGSPKVKASQ